MDWQNRTRRLIGDAGIDKLNRSCVCILGLGGVGSASVEALARAGIGRLIILDSDNVDITNINRQLIATHSAVGKSKCEIQKSRILDINPDCEVITIREFLNGQNSDIIFNSSPQYIIDAIDTVTAKLDIIAKAEEKGIKIISSMGTGNRNHPEMFRIGDIADTAGCGCNLAKVMRRELKKRGVEKLLVVYSIEKPAKTVQSKDGRHIPASISICPPTAGYLLASWVINSILDISGENE